MATSQTNLAITSSVHVALTVVVTALSFEGADCVAQALSAVGVAVIAEGACVALAALVSRLAQARAGAFIALEAGGTRVGAIASLQKASVNERD